MKDRERSQSTPPVLKGELSQTVSVIADIVVRRFLNRAGGEG